LVKSSKPYNESRALGPSYSAYVTYSSAKEAALAVLVMVCNKDSQLINLSMMTD